MFWVILSNRDGISLIEWACPGVKKYALTKSASHSKLQKEIRILTYEERLVFNFLFITN